LTHSESVNSKDQAFYSSLVVEHIVTKAKSKAFERWYKTLIQAASRHPGFVRADLNPPLPCEDDVVKWHSIVHFNSPENLNSWVSSSARKQIVENGQTILRAYRFKSFTTGLEGWFSERNREGEQSGLGPPVWKQILSVVFGLYPLVMVRIKLFPGTGVIGDWSPSAAMLLATLVTSAILAIAIMPTLTRLMGFWLYPAYRESRWKADVLGTIVMGLGLMFMVGIFDRI